MRSLLALLVLTLALSIFSNSVPVLADDGIPDNCEYAQLPDQRAIIPRYSVSARRLVLVSWTSGEEVRTLASDVQVMQILGWSAHCRFLAVAEGTSDVTNTVVYDTTTGERMGSVDDAHHQPHHITWGYDDHLVVETRNGAILWHVPTGQRFILTQSYNTTTARNFNRLRWDGVNGQLIADLAVGGRIVYDLATGAVVPVAAQQPDSRTVDGNAPQVIIGGRSYACLSSYRYGYRNWFGSGGVPDVALHYDVQNHLISLQLNDIYGSESVIQTLEDDVQASYVVNRGWSPTCRYIAASLGVLGQDASDTVVYDVVAGRRVGEVSDARHIPHPIQWGSDGKTLLVQTRQGAILWDLAANTQTTISDAVEIPLAGRSDVRNFTVTAWTDGQLLAVPVVTPDSVVAFDPTSGDAHTVATFNRAVKDLFSASGGWGIAALELPGESYDRQAVFFHTDGTLQADLGVFSSITLSDLTISPDGLYFVLSLRVGLGVWDTSTGAQVGLYHPEQFYSYQFVDNVTLRSASGATLNVVTGVLTPAAESTTAAPAARAGVDGQDGESAPRGWWEYYYSTRYYPESVACKANDASVYYDPAERAIFVNWGGTNQVLVPNLNMTLHLAWSPDCRIITGGVAVISNAALPYDDAPLDDIYRDDLSYDVTFWDATTGDSLGIFPRPYRFESPARIDWSPGSERAFVRTTQGYFIFDPATHEQIPLYYTGAVESGAQINTYYHLYWDFSHGRLFVDAWGGTLVYDIRTGERIAYLTPGESNFYYGGCEYGGCTFERSAGGRYLYVYGAASLAQYDFLTLQGVHVDVDNSYSVAGRPTATSPDGRYLVVANYEVRVWEVTNLPETFTERDPVRTFHGPEGRVKQVSFVDNTTIAVTAVYGIVSYWNVETGQQVTQQGTQVEQ